MREYVKADEVLPGGRFVLSEPLMQCQGKKLPRRYLTPQYRFLNPKDAKFYIDGDIGFGLGYQLSEAERPIWLCVTSFSAGNNLPVYYQNTMSYFKDGSLWGDSQYDFVEAILRDTRRKCEEYTDPMIVQLQGVSGNYGTYKNEAIYREATDILNRIRWEKALVEICKAWASEAGFTRLLFLPGERIAWNRFDGRRLSRFKVRYDGTAKRMGFRRDHNGFYTFDLDR